MNLKVKFITENIIPKGKSKLPKIRWESKQYV